MGGYNNPEQPCLGSPAWDVEPGEKTHQKHVSIRYRTRTAGIYGTWIKCELDNLHASEAWDEGLGEFGDAVTCQ